MQKKLVTILLVLFTGVLPTLAQTEYCFENKGLKNLNRILFTVSDSEIGNGTFEIESYDGSSEIQSYQFEGTKAANDLTIKFAAETPEDFNTIKKIVWKLGKTLTVPTYGKNNETNKWSVYSAPYEKCEAPDSESNESEPTRIKFAKGASEATEDLNLMAGESKRFIIGAKIGQIFMVDSDSKDLKISMVKGEVSTDATLEEPGHYDTTLLANGDFVFEVTNTSESELNTSIKIIIGGGH